MVVGDLRVASVFAFPAEDDAPLLVDANGMESGEIAFQHFQTIAGRLAKVFE